jgi:23S rRNA pseudouridine1911/1915/1917 synthase
LVALRQRNAPRSADAPPPTLAARVRELEGVSWTRARALVEAGQVDVGGETRTDPALRVPPEAEIAIHSGRPKASAGALDASRIVYVDRDVVVVDKPPGVLTLPYDDGDRDTLVQITRVALKRLEADARYDPELGVVHRLDKHTSGLLVFTRTFAAKRHLAQQFRLHTVERAYLALAHGDCPSGRHESVLLANRGDRLRGSYGHFRRPKGPPPPDARRAVTHVFAQQRLAGASLVECRLETGRQHQIRIHLSEAGHPLVGEPVYIRDYRGTPLVAPRPMLHARTLGFEHPRTGEVVRFEAPCPPDFLEALRRLGGKPPVSPGHGKPA